MDPSLTTVQDVGIGRGHLYVLVAQELLGGPDVVASLD